MKRFVISVLSISVFFVGLGSLADKVGAKFKSDEKALEIVRKARTAIGGDSAIAEVRSLTIVGRTTHTFKLDGAERSEQGETEIALQLPDKLAKTVKIGKDDGSGDKMISRQHDVIVVGKGDGEKMVLESGKDGEFTTSDGKKVVIKHRVDGDPAAGTEDIQKIVIRKGGDGTGTGTSVGTGNGVAAGEKHVMMMRHGAPGAHAGMKQNELLRLTLALLLTAPDGIEVNYTFAGESNVDGAAVNIINAEFGGSNYKLFIGKSSNLPVAMSSTGMQMPTVVKFTKEMPAQGDQAKSDVFFTKKIDADAETAEHFVRFTDYRSIGGVQLPYKWTTTIGGVASETFDVTSYEVNPPNIAEKFQNQKVFVRTKKEQ